MRLNACFSLVVLLVCAIVAGPVPVAADAAPFGIEKFFSGTCGEAFPECSQEGTVPFREPKDPSKAEAELEGFSLAGGHVPFGVTDFQVASTGAYPDKVPNGITTHIRTDVAAGFSTAPPAVPQCSEQEFGRVEAGQEGSGLYPPSTCKPETKVGIQHATVYVKEAGVAKDVALEGTVYNLVQKPGLASEFGVAIKLPIPVAKELLSEVLKKPVSELEAAQTFAHTLIEGSVEYAKEAKGTNEGDYHDYFEIDVSPSLPLVRSRLFFEGHAGNGAFLTNATNCPGHTTTTLTVFDQEGATAREGYTPPVPVEHCNLVPFEPGFTVKPATAQIDQPDGIATEATLQHDPTREIDNSDVRTATVSLPVGMTLNPAAARGLATCTPAQARLHSTEFGTSCPAGSLLGTVTLETPNLPAGSLQGNVYLGGPEGGGPITAPPFTMYIDAQSSRYGVDVRLQGSVTPDPVTGRVSTTFSENPEQPFSNLILHFKGGALAPLANPLSCGPATSTTSFTPFSGTPTQSPFSSFAVDNAGAVCPSPPSFLLSQGTVDGPLKAGAPTSYTLNIARPDAQQFLSQVKTTLPAGLVGLIPTVTQCGEAQANAGTCPATSKIGVVVVESGAGPTPYAFNGDVYLTGPYNGAPFGLSIVVATVAGPFNFGNVITRAAINIDPYTTRVITTSAVPTIVKGVPVHLKHISVDVNKPGFLVNPTNCGPLSTDSAFNGLISPGLAATAIQSLSSPFQAGACNGLSFKPSFKSKTSAKASKANGASLETTLDLGKGQANVKSVLVALPRQLPSRLTTLQKACSAAVFDVNPFHCPAGSFVGGARANTPALPGKLKGPAILVSHGGAAFPDLDLVMEDDGVRVIVVGKTNITKGITSTNFAAAPDAPVSSITVNLPAGPHSALAANGSLCTRPLVLPTTITGQNGIVIKQNTKIRVAECPVRIIGHRVNGNNVYITVQTYAKGRLSVSGPHVTKISRQLKTPVKRLKLTVRLSRRGQSMRRPLNVKLRVGFRPTQKHEGASSATTQAKFT